MKLQRLLGLSRISIITSHPDAEVGRLRSLLGDHIEVDGRIALERALGDLANARAGLVAAPAAKTLDLIGHSTPDGLLRLGDWIVDGESPTVTSFFRNIADVELLPRLGVTALRVLGCGTAATTRSRTTLKILAELLGLEVYGTTAPIYNLHYDSDGFSEQWRFLLSAASEPMPAPGDRSAPLSVRRTLDIDALPLVSLGDRPRALVSGDTARVLLSLVDRTAGALMPGLLAIPCYELALVSHDAKTGHIVEVILDGQFIRVYPDGPDLPGIVYPVRDARALLAIAGGLPSA